VVILLARAIFAISGLTPEPVPFPNPAIMKRISVFELRIFSTSALFSVKASLPIEGFPPEPNPFNFFSPIKNKEEFN
jgi:hypothetical protein